jgi:hypothetical protein
MWITEKERHALWMAEVSLPKASHAYYAEESVLLALMRSAELTTKRIIEVGRRYTECRILTGRYIADAFAAGSIDAAGQALAKQQHIDELYQRFLDRPLHMKYYPESEVHDTEVKG